MERGLRVFSLHGSRAIGTDRVGSYAWKAWLMSNPAVWELGQTEAEAIGKLVITISGGG